MIKAKRWAAAVAAVTCLAGVVVLGMDKAHHAPWMRLHGGAAWLASSKVGELTLLDGASAEVAARVPVAPPGAPIRASQLGSTGYAHNLRDGSVVRVDGATLQPSTPTLSAGRLFPTPQALYAFDPERGLVTPLDPVTMAPLGVPRSLAAEAEAEAEAEHSIVDGSGRLWILDARTGDLTWLSLNAQHSRTDAGTALAAADGRPVTLDLARRRAELLDPETGSVDESMPVGVRSDDTVAVAGSPGKRRILISIASRGLLLVCEFGASCENPVPLGPGKADLGAAVEVGDHAIVPDYSTGRVWIVNLETMRVVAERQLFDRAVRFELLTRDGVVFYNDPDSAEAGILDLNGNVRAVSKYNPVKPDSGPVQVAADNRDTSRQQPPSTGRPRSGPTGAAPPVRGPGDTEPVPVGAPAADIVIKPSNRGLVGEEFELAAVARGPIGLATARWTFGDGTSATGLVVRHRWDRPGEFQVNVATTLAIGLPAPPATATVVIEPADAPVRIAGISVDPEAPRVGEVVRFGAEVTGRRPDRWEWFVQGEPVSSAPDFQHTFAAPGTYTVTLAVTAGAVRVQQSRQATVAPEPPPVGCGDVLIASAVLKNDLVCPQEVALTIAADNVTLDLGGHSITTRNPTENSAGIKVAGPAMVRNTTIKNGRVDKFASSIALASVAGVRISHVGLSASEPIQQLYKGVAIRAVNAQGVSITDASIGGHAAFVFQDGSEVTISDSRVEDRAAAGGKCLNRSSCTILRSTVLLQSVTCANAANEVSSSLRIDGGVLGVWNIGDLCQSVIVRNAAMTPARVAADGALEFAGNTVSHKHDWPKRNDMEIFADNAASSLIADNTFSEMQVGLTVHGPTGHVVRNAFFGNHIIGLKAIHGRSMVVSENTFAANGPYYKGSPMHHGGLIYTADRDGQVNISNNHARDNTGYAIYAENAAGDGNTTSGDEKGCHGVVCGPP
ncbi:PKD domain-containing protein [Kibdelosporangium aridum]|uniref:PKD domain-containing protein n=1 Tax=Kibdelosporangium aridum TaxID=2030 RepID=A0A428ZIP4_KIBAR|nr:PKD domain-containing protein [Kibdelosporangium aridum]RSM87976.1 PKD domain-containing protein [Kibdelosporangium aridum]